MEKRRFRANPPGGVRLLCSVAFSAPRGSGQLRSDVILKQPPPGMDARWWWGVSQEGRCSYSNLKHDENEHRSWLMLMIQAS